MCNEEIKAPVIEGYENITVSKWQETPSGESINLYSGFMSKAFYYRRIKPKEKSIKEIVSECYNDLFQGDHPLVQSLERILENYVKKEG